MITIDGGRSDDLECRTGADVGNCELDVVVIVWTPTSNCNTPLCRVDDGLGHVSSFIYGDLEVRIISHGDEFNTFLG